MSNLNEYVELLSQVVESRENYQRKLGQVASTVAELYGVNALYDLCKEVEEATGRRLPYNTLKNYRWVYEKTAKYELPDDITYHVLQLLATRPDIEQIVEQIKTQGLTSDDVYHIVKKEPKKKKKKFTCKFCGKEN